MITSNNSAKITSAVPNTLLHIAGYKFIPLDDLENLQQCLLNKATQLNLKGTILLSPEGININLAGETPNVISFKEFLETDDCLKDITFHETKSDLSPYQFLKVKIKKEIITMREPDIKPEINKAPYISPQELKQWLDQGKDMTLLDSRNHYEVLFGTFENAINPNIANFSSFSNLSAEIDKEKPVVTFCTGGIRCEKAALLLLQQGFKEVYQLEKGILNYFKEVGGEHYKGECFVFDQRIAVNPNLQVSGTQQCKICQGPIKVSEKHSCKSEQ